MARNDALASMTVKIAANTAQFNAAVKQTQGQLKAFGDQISFAAKSFVAGFGAMQIANFALDVSRLAGEAEGVRMAFDKLPNSVKLMNDLKEATAGTVSELDLMKRAVMASNFGISLEALPKLLEFASVRAKQTGQSVDYLVDSIVTGIGRKSKLILDNLGISAVQLTEALGGASTAAASIEDVANAVGNIAAKELERMGSMSENASTKIERLAGNWVNLNVAVGNAANVTGLLGSAVDALNSDLVRITDTIKIGFKGALVEAVPFLDTMLGKVKTLSQAAADEQTKQAQVIKEVDRAMQSANPEAYIKAMAQHVYYAEILNEYNSRLVKSEKEKGLAVENIANLTEKLNLLNTDQLTLTGAQLLATNKEIKSIEEKIKKLKELGLEVDRQAGKDRAAALARIASLSITGPTVAGFDTSKISFSSDQLKGIESMKSAYDGITASIARMSEAQKNQIGTITDQRMAFAQLASSMSDTIAVGIASEKSFAEVFAATTAQLLDGIQQRILANIALGSSQAFAKNPYLGIGVVAAGFGIAKGLLGMIARGGNERSNNVRPYSGERMSSQNIVVTGVIRGQDIYISNQNYMRNNRSTSFIVG